MRIAGNEPHIIILTEIIPKAQILPISPATLAIHGYSFYVNFDWNLPRLGASGIRGICVYVSEKLHASQLSVSTSIFCEQLWLRVKLKNSDSLLIGSIYRSPSKEAIPSIDELGQIFRQACHNNPTHLVIAGDFNMPMIDWDARFSAAPVGHYSHTFIEMVNACFLFQHINQPTRYRHGETPSVLDLLFSNEESLIRNICYSAGLGSSDHVIIQFEVPCYSRSSLQLNELTQNFNFGKADYRLLNDTLLKANWKEWMIWTSAEVMIFSRQPYMRVFRRQSLF